MDKIKAAMEELTGQEPVRVILSKPKMKSNDCKKVDIHRYRDFYQAERQVGKQMFHDNIPFSGLAEYICAKVPEEYRQINAFTQSQEWMVSVTKKGRGLCDQKEAKNPRKSARDP